MPLLLKDQSTRSVCGAQQLFRTVPLSKSSLSTTFRELFGVELRPEVQPPLMAFISEPHFSGLNWNPHPGSTPHWYLSSLSTTFRGWTQTRGSTPHWWLSSLNVTFRGWTGNHILVQPPTGTFHLWAQLFGVEQTRGSTPHWRLSSLNLTFRGWTGTHILVQPPTDTFHLWAQLFGVELRPEVQPPLMAFISERHFSGLNPLPIAREIPLGPTSWFNPPLIPFISEHNFSGLNSDPRFNPPLMAFISERHFSGLNWNPHPGSTPHWYLSSLSTTFGVELRPEVQPAIDGFHLCNPPLVPFISEHNLSGLNSDPRFNLSLMAFISERHFSGLNWNPHPVQPRTGTFHLWAQLFGVELRPEVQPPIDGFHLWTSLFGVELEPTSWFNPRLIPFISEHNFSGLNSDPRFNPPLMAFISEPHFFGVEPMPIAINMAYGGQYWHPSICSPRNKPWEYKPKPNRFLVHSHFVRTETNPNEPKAYWKDSMTLEVKNL